uniref:Scavenger receptor class B n=2 Tax=gambiae species complex TaxID=44542 RepID=A0A8W7PS66_ANOCL
MGMRIGGVIIMPLFLFYLILPLMRLIVLLLLFSYFWSTSKEKSLLPGSTLYKEWRRPTERPSWQFYVYNWSNAQAILEHQASSASFQEIGPFQYEEVAEVVDVKYHQANGTLSYRKRTFFRPSGPHSTTTNGTESERIISVNFVALLASHFGHSMDYSVQRELSFMLHNFRQTVTVTRTIGQLLFTGYREPMMEPLRKLVCPTKRRSVACQDERLAYFRTFNVTRRASEVYSLDVGLKDRSKYGTVRSWGAASVPAAHGEFHPCDGFAGLTGEFFPSRIERDQAIVIVLPELCRRLTLEFDREQLVAGIMGFRYAVRLVRPFRSAQMSESNMQSCPDTSIRLGRYGILNTNECNGFPLYESDQAHVSSNESTSFSSDSDLLYYLLEPTTGTVIESNIDLTYHTFLRPNEHIALFQSVPELRIPLFRFARYYRLSEMKAAKLRQLLHLLDVGHQIALAGCVAGLTIILLAVVYACWKAQRPSKTNNDQYRIIGMQLSDGGREHNLLK